MDIRKEFINFFKSKGHQVHESSPLVPDDETLLFTNAGMVQFKKIFTGELPIPENPRATSSQICLRAGGKHNDLENVGYTARHHTLFEMLGNFSFGDYFKDKAIEYSWEFVTEVLKLPKERLWVTVHNSDDEAFEIWKRYISEERIKRLGDKDNFWQMGDTGPCGPSSEIFYDQGDEFNSPDDYLGGDGDRFLEIWNLVFMEYDRDESGKLNRLPKPSIDTGMGLERVTAILEGKNSNFHTSLFMPIIDKVAQLIGKEYQPEEGASYRVIADHIRAVTFLLAQGLRFDREGRGYVLRRILRRAVRHGYLLGFREPFLYQLVESVNGILGKQYPYLISEAKRVQREIRNEEERFFRTIEAGIELFEQELERTENIFSGEVAFKLYDTYGFPLDLTQDMLREKNIEIDLEKFQSLMEEQRKRAKANWKGSGDKHQHGDFKELLEEFGENQFLYETTQTEGKVLALLDKDFRRVTSCSDGWVLFDRTPFYGESGGQIGDRGKAGQAEILDTQKFSGLNLSRFRGDLEIGKNYLLQVSEERHEIAKHHSATHLLHATLRNILGDEVQQAGSLVEKDRLRFDFTYSQSLSAKQLRKIEDEINRYISQAIPQTTEVLPIEEARAKGAMALFGEKYGDRVRVVSFGDVSVELCGGTHVSNTSEIGIFLILKESGVSAGVRRIEAVVGESGYRYIQNVRDEVAQGLQKLKSQNLLSGIEKLQKELSKLKQELKEVQKSQKHTFTPEKIGELNLIVDILPSGDIKSYIDELKNRYSSIAVMLFQKKGDKVLIASGSKNCNIHAGNWIKAIAPIVKGGGGGRPDFAQAGGKDSSKIEEAIKEAKKYAKDSR
ncbi:MAG TPA: alanine--tRNA ligase [Campylobacterales bacterium]|nr:alanine--tRNA ligase [Campylobacterales bacterium]